MPAAGVDVALSCQASWSPVIWRMLLHFSTARRGWYWSNVLSNGLRRRADGFSASAGGVRLDRSRRVLPLVCTMWCVPRLLETWRTHGIYCVTTLKPIRAAASDAAELPCPRQVLRANIVGWDK